MRIAALKCFIAGGKEIDAEPRIKPLTETLRSLGVKTLYLGKDEAGSEEPYSIIVVARGGYEKAVELLLRPHTRGALLVSIAGLEGLGEAVEVKDKALRAGKKVELIHFPDPGKESVAERLSLEVKALRASSSALDMKILLFGVEPPPIMIEDWARRAGLDLYLVPGREALELFREGSEYGSLYVDTYLAAYFDLSGISEEVLSRELGLYLAVKSVLDSEGANAVLVDCEDLSSKAGIGALMALNLLQDEGVPSACTSFQETLLPQMISYTLTGSPSIPVRLIDIDKDKMVLKALTLPTAASARSQIENEEGIIRIKGHPGEGSYVAIAVAKAMDRAHVLELEVLKDHEPNGPQSITASYKGDPRGILENLRTANMVLLKRVNKEVVAKALYYLGMDTTL